MTLNPIGAWKIVAAQTMDENFNNVWKPVEEILADENETDKGMYLSLFIFKEDGTLCTAAVKPDEVPQEELDKMVAEGKVEKYGDNHYVIERREWKEEDGKIYYDSKVTGEIMGQPVSPWAEIVQDGDSLILMVYKLARA